MGDDRARLRRLGRAPAGFQAGSAPAPTGGVARLSGPGRAARLTLVCQGATVATRLPAFAADTDALDEASRRLLPGLRAELGPREQVLAAPSRAARDTAEGLAASVSIDPALRECDFGDWIGRPLAALEGNDAEALGRWLGDPEARPPGGEALVEVLARLRPWLETCATAPVKRTAVASSYIVRSIVVAALNLPPQAFWRLDAAPLSVTRLTALNGRWRLACFGARS